jgi:phosphohistidine phosphatase SixA
MVIGHNPGLEALVTILTGRMELMPTAAIAHVLLPIDQWNQLTVDIEGELQNLWRPKALT